MRSKPKAVSPPSEIRGKRVRLTPLQIENIHTHFQWNNDPELNRLDSELPFREERFGTFKRRFELMMQPTAMDVDLEIHEIDGPLIGVVYISEISRHNRHCRVGLSIGDRDYWGRGFGREALELVLAYCFDELRMHRVAAETFEFGTAWQNLVEGTGFHHEGVSREYLFRDGKYWDKHLYAMLATEYEARDVDEDEYLKPSAPASS